MARRVAMESAYTSWPAILAVPEVAGMMSETGAVPSAPSVGVTREEAKAKLSDIRDNPNHPANNEMDPKYEEAREEVMKLYRAAYS